MVAGSLANSSSPTGNLLTKDVPKSSCKTPFTHSRYCMIKGLSVPNSSRKACIASGVGAILASRRMTSAGSTGTKRINTKVRIDTPTNTNGSVRILFTQNIQVDSYMSSLPISSDDKKRVVLVRHTLSFILSFLYPFVHMECHTQKHVVQNPSYMVDK